MPPGQADLLNLFKGYFMRSVITLHPRFSNSYPGVGKSHHEQDGLGPGVVVFTSGTSAKKKQKEGITKPQTEQKSDDL